MGQILIGYFRGTYSQASSNTSEHVGVLGVRRSVFGRIRARIFAILSSDHINLEILRWKRKEDYTSLGPYRYIIPNEKLNKLPFLHSAVA